MSNWDEWLSRRQCLGCRMITEMNDIILLNESVTALALLNTKPLTQKNTNKQAKQIFNFNLSPARIKETCSSSQPASMVFLFGPVIKSNRKCVSFAVTFLGQRVIFRKMNSRSGIEPTEE